MKDTIIPHHSASSSSGSQYEGIVEYHNNGAGGKIRPGRGAAYHWFIEKDGKRIEAHDESFICDNSGNWVMNQRSIAVCLAGDFTKEMPTNAQIETFTNLVTEIQCRWGIPDERIILHKEVTPGHTECPGIDLRKIFFEHRLKILLDRIPKIQEAIKRASTLRKIVLTRLLNRLQKLTPKMQVPT